ncbi:MAG: C-GCAxxG-C-C family protein [Bacteroidetes bacterium]|nr:C-GCAxxG-C-C family protein [Bacteroidota bacterium]
MKRSEKALSYYSNGYNCAQSVVAAFFDLLKMDEKVVLRMVSGFGGGMGRMQQTCGAVTGAFMIISFMRGKYDVNDTEAKEITNKLIQDFSAKFVARHGTINCKELIKYDLSTEEGRKQAKEANVFNAECSKFVQLAVEILEELLLKQSD